VNLRSSPRKPAHAARTARKPAPLRTRVRAAASGAILDAAEQVASERGLEEASCAAIAKRAGVAVGTLYNYFPDRNGILAALFKSRREQLIPRVTGAAAAHAHLPFEPRLRGFVKDVMAAYEELRQFLRLALDADRVMPNVKDPRSTLMMAFTAALEAIFRDAGKAGAFPKGREAIYARMVLGSLKSLVHWHLEQGRPLTADVDLVLDAFMRGLGDPE
jgi:AcrR family transcriptional regulator